MTRRRYNIRESLNRILRLFEGKSVPTDIPDTIPGEVLSVDEAMSDLAELLGDSLPNESAELPNSLKSPLKVDYIQYDTTPSVFTFLEGQSGWNVDEGTLDIGQAGSNVTLQVGQELYFYVKNQSGEQIDNGTVVRFGGSLGSSGRLLIEKALADGSFPSIHIMGITTEDIPDGEDGYVTVYGKIRGLQTNGANYGESWSDGDILYISSTVNGGLTKNLPEAPNLKLSIAAVVNAHNSNGTLFVRPTIFPNISEINDINITGTSQRHILYYHNLDSRWENSEFSNVMSLGGIKTPIKTVYGDYSITGDDCTVLVNTASGTSMIVLPSVSICANQLFHVLKVSSSNTCIISGSANINVSGSYVLTSQYDGITIQSNGVSWYIIK